VEYWLQVMRAKDMPGAGQYNTYKATGPQPSVARSPCQRTHLAEAREMQAKRCGLLTTISMPEAD